MGLRTKIRTASRKLMARCFLLSKQFATAAGLEVRRVPTELARVSEAIKLLHAFEKSQESRQFLSCAVKYFSASRSQFMQDLFVLSVLDEKRNGYFVEFGGLDGVTFSNSYILENEFGWAGVVVEPSRGVASSLAENRRCTIDTRCVWSNSGEKRIFAEVKDFTELSTLAEFAYSDSFDRSNAFEYLVETVSLNDLLEQHGAPVEIDYLSIDTEGSELEILAAFDFDRWHIRVITVEHNYVSTRRKRIYDLLTANGYERVLTGVSRCDDWYIRTAVDRALDK